MMNYEPIQEVILTPLDTVFSVFLYYFVHVTATGLVALFTKTISYWNSRTMP